MGRGDTDRSSDDALPQEAAVDVDFDLTGCVAIWTPTDGTTPWTGWLPHFDLEVARQFTAGSNSHDALWKAMAQPGELKLRTRLDLTDMLRPEVQPGSKLDYEFPPEIVHVTLETSTDAAIELVEPARFIDGIRDDKRASFTLPADAPRHVEVTVLLATSSSSAPLHVSWTTAEDDTPRPLPLRRQLVPWSTFTSVTDIASHTGPIPELAGGDWERGRQVYFSEDAACSKCHLIHGRGGQIGPDLTNLVHRDYASVLRDITQPSFAINPDHVSNVVILKDGRVFSGVMRTLDGQLSIGDIQGNVTIIDRDDVEETTASPVSTMPQDLSELLGLERMRDLMTFLLTAAPEGFVWPVKETTP
jgi:putative heme-binding domain-containing protein